MKFEKWITVSGAREHNLKNITVSIPKDALTVITGPSGSGKSSLALDVLFSEGQRRYLESLSSYARQFLGMPKKPDVDAITGLCPAIAIDQKTVGANPRSTVGTITEIYDYLRVLYARIGKPHCPRCKAPIQAVAPDVLVALLQELFHEKDGIIIAPIIIEKKGEFTNDIEKLFLSGFYRFTIDGEKKVFRNIEEIRSLGLKKTHKHTIEVLIDAVNFVADETSRILEALEKAFSLAQGMCIVWVDKERYTYSSQRMCMSCHIAYPEIEPRLFSFNSPLGACHKCHGLGSVYDIARTDSDYTQYTEVPCPMCHGKRLHEKALSVFIGGKNIYDLGQLSLKELYEFIERVELSKTEKCIAQRLMHEINSRLNFLCNVGLNYLSLNRTARTLSGGEGQRIRLATQIGSALSGVLYILDEPSIGLHQRDNDRLIATLHTLKNQGNTVVVVEHDADTMLSADYIIDMGPAAGVHGGTVVAAGTPQEIMDDKKSLTGAYLSGKRLISRKEPIRTPTGFITLTAAQSNNLKNITVQFPLGVLCVVSGVSGSGKSTLVMQELVPALEIAQLYKGKIEVSKIQGVDQIENVVVIDQAPIGRTPRSNPATYLGIFDEIRKLFAAQPESNARGYKVGRFSFNVGEGRCSECTGDGIITVSLQFLPDVTMVCTRCKGKRYNAQTLEILYRGKNIADVLAMTAREAVDFFNAHTALAKRLQLLCDVGLDYIQLGQASTTLSGGEAQRIKLTNELAKRGSKTLYILDEPTTGLHAVDVEKLLMVFDRLIAKGNSLLVIEHNLDVLKVSDYIIDLGPEGGAEGGFIVAQGIPAVVAKKSGSYTGFYLQKN